MAIMKSCCCFSNMKSACVASAIFTIVMGCLGIISAILVKLQYIHVPINPVFYIVPIIIYIVLLIAGVLLLTGSRRGYKGRSRIMAYIVIVGIYLLLDLGVIICAIVFLQPYLISLMMIQFALLVVEFIVFILAFLAAISLHQLLTKEGPDGPLSQRDIHHTNHHGGAYPMPVHYPSAYPPSDVQYPPAYSGPYGEPSDAYGGNTKHAPPSMVSLPPSYTTEEKRSFSSHAPSVVSHAPTYAHLGGNAGYPGPAPSVVSHPPSYITLQEDTGFPQSAPSVASHPSTYASIPGDRASSRYAPSVVSVPRSHVSAGRRSRPPTVYGD